MMGKGTNGDVEGLKLGSEGRDVAINASGG